MDTTGMTVKFWKDTTANKWKAIVFDGSAIEQNFEADTLEGLLGAAQGWTSPDLEGDPEGILVYDLQLNLVIP